jgi:hypothetical protein
VRHPHGIGFKALHPIFDSKNEVREMFDLKQMQKMQKQLQEQFEALQKEAKTKRISASAGGGAVRVTVNGEQQVLEIKIKPEAVDPDDMQMLEDLIMAAVNSAIEQSKQLAQNEMGKITGGFKLPGLF